MNSYVGNLVRDVEVRNTSNNITVANFTIAINEKFENSDKEITTYLDFEAWGYKALDVSELKKGTKIVVQALPRNDVWEKDGKKYSKVKFRVVEVGVCPRAGKKVESVQADEAPAAEVMVTGKHVPF